jgi:deazaflavin-dependent oxidoreductase (nitroreductase family)
MSIPENYNQTVIEAFRANGGQLDGSHPLLLLTTTGAQSGRFHTTSLAYSIDGDHLVIAASNDGAPTNPDWYHNVLANPIVTVELGHERFQARATVVKGHERELLYAHH